MSEVSFQARLKIKNRSVSSVESKLAAPGLDSEGAGVVCLLVVCVCLCMCARAHVHVCVRVAVPWGYMCSHFGRTMPGQSGVTVTS